MLKPPPLRQQLRTAIGAVRAAEEKLNVARLALEKARAHEEAIEAEQQTAREVELAGAESVANQFIEGIKPGFTPDRPAARSGELSQLKDAIVVLEKRVADAERALSEAQGERGVAVAAVLREKMLIDHKEAVEAKQRLVTRIARLQKFSAMSIFVPGDQFYHWAANSGQAFASHLPTAHAAAESIQAWRVALERDCEAQLLE